MKNLIAFGMVAAISQKGENRHFSATITPENTAWEPLQSRNCQGQNAKRKSVSAGRCAVALYRSFPPVTPYRTVSRYVHLNPVRAGLVRQPEQWPWSSYPGYRDA